MVCSEVPCDSHKYRAETVRQCDRRVHDRSEGFDRQAVAVSAVELGYGEPLLSAGGSTGVRTVENSRRRTGTGGGIDVSGRGTLPDQIRGNHQTATVFRFVVTRIILLRFSFGHDVTPFRSVSGEHYDAGILLQYRRVHSRFGDGQLHERCPRQREFNSESLHSPD